MVAQKVGHAGGCDVNPVLGIQLLCVLHLQAGASPELLHAMHPKEDLQVSTMALAHSGLLWASNAACGGSPDTHATPGLQGWPQLECCDVSTLPPSAGQGCTLVCRPMRGLMAQPYLAPKMVLTSMQVSWELPSTTSSTAPGPTLLLPFLPGPQAVRHQKSALLHFHSP